VRQSLQLSGSGSTAITLAVGKRLRNQALEYPTLAPRSRIQRGEETDRRQAYSSHAKIWLKTLMSLDPRSRATTGCHTQRGLIVSVGESRKPNAALTSEATQADVPSQPTERIQRGMFPALPRETGGFAVEAEPSRTERMWRWLDQILRFLVAIGRRCASWGRPRTVNRQACGCTT